MSSVEDNFKELLGRIQVEIDSAVRTVLESGASLEWARLGERGSSIRIK